MELNAEMRGVRGEWIAGPFDGLPAMLNGFYGDSVVVLVCDYSGRYSHVHPGDLSRFFKPENT